MPFCANCGTQVSEDTRFCPECGRPFTIVGQAGSGEGKNKKKIAGIIAACIVAIIVVVVIATHTPTSVEPEPAIPAHFTTYADELGLFSISYPPEWELDLENIAFVEQMSKAIISSIESNAPVETFSCIFMAGLPATLGHNPNVNVVVEPNSGMTHDQVVAAGIRASEAFLSDYRELSRVKTTIDSRTATIIESQADFAGLGNTLRYVQMIFLVGKTTWSVTCSTSPDEYSRWEDDFDSIVGSLRILK